MRVGDGRHQPQRELILRHRHDRAAGERARKEKLERREQKERDNARHQHAQRQVDEAEAQRRPDIARLDITVVDAEHDDQHHFGDEQQAEEKSEPAERFPPAPLKRGVVDLIDRGAERIEHRQHHDADHDRIDAEAGVDDIGDIGAEDDESRMRDVDDVEDAERDRNPDRHRGIEAAEQQAGDQGVDKAGRAETTTVLPGPFGTPSFNRQCAGRVRAWLVSRFEVCPAVG